MMRFNSPLRYPGGKGKLTGYFADVLRENDLVGGTYIEPFAGGAGTAINLLTEEMVSEIVINDADPSVFAFWKAITEYTDDFITQLKSVKVDIDEWKKQRDVQLRKHTVGIFELGFSTFYLNRTNRSGILDAGPIGGLQQTGDFKIDARFNKTALADRIRSIGDLSDKITVSGFDAGSFLKDQLPKHDVSTTMVYIDPPYYVQGSNLYMNAYDDADHVELASIIKDLKHKWILSYDHEERIKEIYDWKTPTEFFLQYSLNEYKKGREVFYISDALKLPDGEITYKAIDRSESKGKLVQVTLL